jgi:hypothetical protein
MAVASEDDDDNVPDEQELFSPESESEWLFSLEIVFPCSSLITCLCSLKLVMITIL